MALRTWPYEAPIWTIKPSAAKLYILRPFFLQANHQAFHEHKNWIYNSITTLYGYWYSKYYSTLESGLHSFILILIYQILWNRTLLTMNMWRNNFLRLIYSADLCSSPLADQIHQKPACAIITCKLFHQASTPWSKIPRSSLVWQGLVQEAANKYQHK
jgi:hypothetical protein